jgi:lysine-ketoglutarate reductase/saccharopine dehydrogenase-like protein (TIGR00300 family)
VLSETVTLEGHIVDSNLLSLVLDDIGSFGAEFEILEIHIGRTRLERSHARIEVRTETIEQMTELLSTIGRHGALWEAGDDAKLSPAPADGAFPDDFYVTTNQPTRVRCQGRWLEVANQAMHCGIVYEPATAGVRCTPLADVRRGELVVCGQHGVNVRPVERQRGTGLMEFRSPEVSARKPQRRLIKNCAALMHETRRDGGRIMLVGGPAIVHTGATRHVVWLIEHGYVQLLFGSNALAAYDSEHSLFGTSMGVYIDKAALSDVGHEHHLRAINTIRAVGGIRAAVERGVLTRGILHACVKHHVELLLAGSVQDDDPLPEVITDTVVAQRRLREAARGVRFALMAAAAMNSVAAAKVLAGWTPMACADISPEALAKVVERGTSRTVALVTDVEPFLRSLTQALEAQERPAAP